MENRYLEEITTLLKQARPKLSTTHQLKFKMFLVRLAVCEWKNIYLLWKFGIALNFHRKLLTTFFKEKDVKHLKYFPRGHIKRIMRCSKRILENKRQFQTDRESIQSA